MQIPDFSMSSPGTVNLEANGVTANVGSIRVSQNQAFSGSVALSTVADSNDPANPLMLRTMLCTVLDPCSPISYTPNNPVTPSLGAGTSVAMQDAQMSDATPGIYALWLKGQAGSPYLTTKCTPFALNVGTVGKDFTITADASEQAAVGNTVTFILNLKRSGDAFGGTGVNLSLEPLPDGCTEPSVPDRPMPAGIGPVSFSPANVTPGNGNGTDSTLSINTGTMAPGIYPVVVRATGRNATDQPVTRLLVLTLDVGTTSSGGNQEYVDIVGFAVMRVAAITSNSVTAYAITPVITDPSDSRLRLGQVARLSPWN
jgi:hypothetical protein